MYPMRVARLKAHRAFAIKHIHQSVIRVTASVPAFINNHRLLISLTVETSGKLRDTFFQHIGNVDVSDARRAAEGASRFCD